MAWNPFSKKPTDPGQPKDVYVGLRQKWLGGGIGELAGADVGPTDVIAVLMEFGREGGVATFVAANDGTASMYTSGGGGTIGMGFHATTAAAAFALVRSAQSFVGKLPKVASPGVPVAGNVAFHLVTKSGIHSIDFQDKDVRNTSPIAPLHLAGHHLVTCVRLLDEKIKKASVAPQTLHVHIFSDGGIGVLTPGTPMPTILATKDLAKVLAIAKAHGDKLEVSVRAGNGKAQSAVLNTIQESGLPRTSVPPPDYLMYSKGATSLHHAVDAGRLDVLQDLVERGSPVDPQDESGYSPLILAAFIGRTPAVKALVSLRANVNLVDQDGNSPLMFAAQSGDLESVNTLLAAGADIQTRAKNGYTALKVANLCSKPAVAKVLIARGATE